MNHHTPKRRPVAALGVAWGMWIEETKGAGYARRRVWCCTFFARVQRSGVVAKLAFAGVALVGT